MKRFISTLLIITFLLCLVGCAFGEENKIEVEGDNIAYMGNFDYSKYTVYEKNTNGEVVKKSVLKESMLDVKSKMSLYVVGKHTLNISLNGLNTTFEIEIKRNNFKDVELVTEYKYTGDNIKITLKNLDDYPKESKITFNNQEELYYREKGIYNVNVEIRHSYYNTLTATIQIEIKEEI